MLHHTNTNLTFFERGISGEEEVTWSDLYMRAKNDYEVTNGSRHKIAVFIHGLLFGPILVIGLFPCVLVWILNHHDQTHPIKRLSDISLHSAIWIVYVPSTKYKCRGGAVGILFPTMAPEFNTRQQANITEGKAIRAEIVQERDDLLILLSALTKGRRTALRSIADQIGKHGADVLETPEQEATVVLLDAKIQLYNHLNSHLDHVEVRLGDIDDRAGTLACQTQTGYRGISDWAKEVENAYHNLFTAISGVSFVGAGLAYASLFSATRGNLGLISWAFCCFVVALVVSITIQSMLLWCSQFPPERPFAAPRIWEIIVGICVFGASMAAIASIAILVCTVWLLQWSTETAEAMGSGAVAAGDAPLAFTVNPRLPAVIAFVTIGLGVVFVPLITILYGVAYGPKRVLWRRSGGAKKRNLTNRKQLADFNL